MKIKLTLIFSLSLLFSISVSSSGQEFFEGTGITDAESDILGNLYVSFSDGSIYKIDSTGKKTNAFTSTSLFAIQQLDVSNNFRIFAFFQSDRRYFLLDRNFNMLLESRFDENGFNQIQAVTYHSDQHLWVFSESDFSLKRLDPLHNQVISSIELTLLFPEERFTISEIEGYQNRIYINNKNREIYVFDSFGNYQKKLSIRTLKKISFFNDEIYYLSDSSLYAMNLYTDSSRKIDIDIQEQERLIKVLFAKDACFLVYEDLIVRKDM